MSKYSEKFKDPRWQKRRLEILNRDEWACQKCFDDEETLHIHHIWYEKGKDPWDYPDECLITLCKTCHEEEFEHQRKAENLLIRTLQSKGFLAGDMNDLACAFCNLTANPFQAEITSALEWILTNPMALLNLYTDWLKKEKEAKKGMAKNE